MANIKSAEKRNRQNSVRYARNHARITRVRTYIRKVETAIESGDKTTAADALRVAQPEIHRGVSKGVLHKKTASRKISRLAARVKALGA